MRTLFDFDDYSNTDPREGERLRDEALDQLRASRPHMLRKLQRAFLHHLLDQGSDTSDPVRLVVPIPAGVDPRIVGSAVRGLSDLRLIISVGRRKTRRAVAHARKVDVWAIRDAVAAHQWLLTHPELESNSSADPDDPFAL